MAEGYPFPATDAPSSGSRLLSSVRAIRAYVARYRGPLFAICGVLFLVGIAVSASRLNLAISDLALSYIAVSALIVVPASMVYGAINFMIMARGAKVAMPFGKSLKISCVAAFAEFLPIPGGAIVRGGALMREGSGAVDAGLHVTVNAVLWIACAAIAAWFALGVTQPVALAIGLGGVVGVLACSLWLATRAGAGIAIAALALRIVGLGIAGARLAMAFLAIGFTVSLLDLYPFVFATIAGSASAIAPGGLGISEFIAAALATLSTIPPEAAFIAVGLNRFIGLVVSGIATAIVTLTSGTKG